MTRRNAWVTLIGSNMKRQKNYDKKVKLTRILLSDYQVLKAVSQQAGISMAEALHRLIEHQRPAPMMAFQVKTHPVIVTNGNRPIYARIRPELRLNLKPTVELQVRAKGVIDGEGSSEV